ncbi:MAG: glycosyltransferase family 2 protein [Desulfoferrobacter sp.]
MRHDAMKISVIIPTLNRPASCARLFASLMPQIESRSLDADAEVILVDDNSSLANYKELVEVLSKHAYGSSRIIRRCCSGGPSAARNTGIVEASGDIIAFLDDDCVPAGDFLGQVLRLHAEYPHAVLINGNLRSLRNDSISQFWFHYYDHAFNGGEGELYQIHRISSGHFSIKRSLLENFDPLFDEGLPSREDYDLYLRVNQAGIPIYKADSINATIECRRTLRELLRQRAWYQRGEILLRQKYGEDFLREAQAGQYPRPSLGFIHIHILLSLDRKIRSLRERPILE